jgi:hypothetical protein
LVSVRINPDVEGERINAEVFGPLHVCIVVRWASAVGDDADLSSC